jgi:hypothetical protein
VSPNGEWIVSAAGDVITSNLSHGELKIWDIASGRELRRLNGHTGSVHACAVSPDNVWIVSASIDKTIKIWEAASGKELLTIPLPNLPRCIALHPWQPIVVGWDESGSLLLFDLKGIPYGPIVVTAFRKYLSLEARCPACQHGFSLEEDKLGSEVTCPNPGCSTRMKVNPSIIQKPVQRKENWLSKLLKK